MRTKMRKLIAEKSHNYATRRLRAGDEYEASELHARILVAARRARYSEAAQPMPQQERAELSATTTVAPTVAPEVADPNDIAKLRAEAARLDIEVDGRWGPRRLEHEIAQVKRR